MTLEEITRIGEKYYLDSLREELEAKHFGEYVVIDVEHRKTIVDKDRLIALNKAQTEFGHKIFYVTQIGSLTQPTINYLAKKHAWNF